MIDLETFLKQYVKLQHEVQYRHSRYGSADAGGKQAAPWLPGRGAIGMALLYKKSGAVDRSLSRGRGTHKQAPAFLRARALRILAEQMICTAHPWSWGQGT